MRSLIKKGCVIISLLLEVFCVSSQSVSNSAYNVFGIGTLEQTGTVPYESMGYASIGARPFDVVNIENPAALNSIRGFTQIFDVGITYSQLSQKSSEDSFSGSFGGLHDLNYWFRASPKTALSVGISKFSDATYDILDSQSGSNEGGRSDSRHIGEGGSSQIYIAGAYSVLPNLHLGLKTSFLFGSLQSEEVLSISNPTTNLEIEKDRRFVKTLLEAGIQYEFQLNTSSKMVLGGIVRTGGTASINEEELILSSTGSNLDSLYSEDESEIHIPQKYGLGLGLQLKSWDINFDYEYESWGSNDDEDAFSYGDRFVTSFGAQYTRDRFSERFIDRVAFRFGGGIHSNYVRVDNEDFLSQYYTFGIGLPVSRGAASINLSYQLYSTGTSNANLIAENVNTFSFSVSIRDLWFRKRVFD